MQKVFDFLDGSELQYFATVGEDGRPKVRPFRLMFREGTELYFCTGAGKLVYRELRLNPYAELCAASQTQWLRISRVVWVDGAAFKRRCIEANALVKRIYGDENNPALRVFRLADATAVLADFSGNPPNIVKLN